ncbi:cell division protein SepF [Corynebacterium choanae]|uniref:Cell division protein SepF n=1 Tax=Corynebacterium choanae TaxID=1862358 RepID=A0A3G6J807_9CORY|nr:cell division protein SepF [Corynebacterium choanae]AZA13942.1 Cell division protein SepF [Corynebacterium choanae]
MSKLQKFSEWMGLQPQQPVDHDDTGHDSLQSTGYVDSYQQAAATPPLMDEPTPSIVPIRVSQFDHAAEIGQTFRDGDIVVFSLSEMAGDEARRIVDYSAGLCHGLRGRMVRLQDRDYALVPEGVEIADYQLRDALWSE